MKASRPWASDSSRANCRLAPSDGRRAMMTRISPAMRLRQAKAQPCLSPPMNEGSDAGRMTKR